MYLSEAEKKQLNNSGFAHRKKLSGGYGCLWDDCGKRTINAHAISRQASLVHFSTNKKLFVMDTKNAVPLQKMEFSCRGIKQIFAFNIFCHTHDQIFSKIDLGIFNTLYDCLLQVYRTMTFNLFQQRCANDHRYWVWNNVLKRCDNTEAYIYAKHEDDSKYLPIMNLIELEKNNVEELIQKQCGINEKIVTNNAIYKLNDKCILLYSSVPFVIPVAVANTLFLSINSSPAIFNYSIIPNCNTTDMIFYFDENVDFQKTWQESSKTPIGIINIIESLLIQSDYWAVKPEIIKNAPLWKRKLIEEDVFCNLLQKFLTPCDYSIFDELRQEFLNMESNEIQAAERDKLTIKPDREDFSERFKQVMKMI